MRWTRRFCTRLNSRRLAPLLPRAACPDGTLGDWARIEGAGFDPTQVKYVLLTHEHGDHAPGAYLWRVITGAQVLASAEMAHVLQHRNPGATGYGFHPPVPVDVVLTGDRVGVDRWACGYALNRPMCHSSPIAG